MKKAIGLPNGKVCGIPEYVASWKKLLTVDPDTSINGWEWYPVEAKEILHELRKGLHDRINRHIPTYGKGRKWAYEWQLDTYRAAQQINHPRLIIDWLPSWLQIRYAYRLRVNCID